MNSAVFDDYGLGKVLIFFIKNSKKILDKKGFVPFIIMVTWLVALAFKIKGKVLLSSLLFLGLGLR